MKVTYEKSKTVMVKVAQTGSDVYDNASFCSAAEVELLYLLCEPQTIGDQKRIKDAGINPRANLNLGIGGRHGRRK